MSVEAVLESAEAYLYEVAPTPAAWRYLQAAFAGQARLARTLPAWPVIELPLRVHAALGGEAEAGVRLAAACALFFSSADIVDDAQDGDLQGVFADRWQQAVNAGNGLIFLSQKLAADAVASRHRGAVLAAFAEAGAAMSFGQARDLDQQGDLALGEHGYWQTIKGKAGASFRLYAAVAAIGLGRSPRLVSALQDFGETYGTAIQLASDMRDLLAAKSRDQRNRQVTLPIIAAWRALSEADRPLFLASWEGAPEAPALAFWLERTGALAHCELHLATLREEAALALGTRAVREAVRAGLGEMLAGLGSGGPPGLA